MISRIVHPRMMEALTRDFFTQICTLKEPNKSQNSVGEEIVTYTTRSGYEAIACRVGQAGGSERRTALMTFLNATHIIVLAGQYPDVTEEWQPEVDGQTYDILRVDPDQQGAMTSLFVRTIQ